MKTIKSMLFCGIVFVLSALDGSGQSLAAAPTLKDIRKVLVLGNSITKHAPNADLGWYGNWGMAASAEEKDYVHLLMRHMQQVNPAAVFHIQTIVAFERGYSHYDLAALDSLRDIKPDLIILHIGENVSTKKRPAQSFGRYYGRLLQFFKKDNPSVKIICISSFWRWKAQQQISAVMEKEAMKRNCMFVRIDGLSADSSNMAIGQFKNRGVAIHPSDSGMRAMAELIWQKIRTAYRPQEEGEGRSAASGALFYAKRDVPGGPEER